MIAQTRTGKQVLNVKGDSVASVCRVVKGDHIAVVGENRKVLIFSIEELPEMGRAKVFAYKNIRTADCPMRPPLT